MSSSTYWRKHILRTLVHKCCSSELIFSPRCDLYADKPRERYIIGCNCDLKIANRITLGFFKLIRRTFRHDKTKPRIPFIDHFGPNLKNDVFSFSLLRHSRVSFTIYMSIPDERIVQIVCPIKKLNYF